MAPTVFNAIHNVCREQNKQKKVREWTLTNPSSNGGGTRKHRRLILTTHLLPLNTTAAIDRKPLNSITVEQSA